VLSKNLSGETEENHKNPKDNLSPGQSEYKEALLVARYQG